MENSLKFIIFALPITFLTGCNLKKSPILSNVSISENTEFGSVYIEVTIDDFLKEGFKYGDSVDLTFSNGVEFKDVPLYSGYFGRMKELMLVAYQGYPWMAFAKNLSTGFYQSLNLEDDDTVTIKRNKEAKYINIEEALAMKYSDDRNAYSSDIEFANFRSLSCGDIKPNSIFRGASPVDNQHNRAKYCNDLIKENNVDFVFNLADSETKYLGYTEKADYKSDYATSLYQEDHIAFMSMTADFSSDDFKQKLGTGLVKGLDSDGPFYVHCTEGKDRTGFVCTLIEALMGATYEEMLNDYMITYKNYYGVDETTSKAKYDALVDVKFSDFMLVITDYGKIEDYSVGAFEYLTDCGMTTTQINSFISKIHN